MQTRGWSTAQEFPSNKLKHTEMSFVKHKPIDTSVFLNFVLQHRDVFALLSSLIVCLFIQCWLCQCYFVFVLNVPMLLVCFFCTDRPASSVLLCRCVKLVAKNGTPKLRPFLPLNRLARPF